jgi:formate/nitrite transporter FocA (FNT family)
MDPAKEKYYRGLFLVATIYDVALGIIFTFFYKAVFDLLDIRDPGDGYVPLLGGFVFVIGVAYFLIYRGDLQRNRDLIIVGTLYKLVYSAGALFFWAIGEVPHVIFAALFGVADAVFFVLMLECLFSLRRAGTTPS